MHTISKAVSMFNTVLRRTKAEAPMIKQQVKQEEAVIAVESHKHKGVIKITPSGISDIYSFLRRGVFLTLNKFDPRWMSANEKELQLRQRREMVFVEHRPQAPRWDQLQRRQSIQRKRKTKSLINGYRWLHMVKTERLRLEHEPDHFYIR